MVLSPSSLLLLLSLLLQSVAVAETLKLGIFAYRPAELIRQRYQPLTDYLNQQLNGYATIELKVMGLEQLDTTMAAREIDLLFTNPNHYQFVRNQYALSGPLVTLIRAENGIETTRLGGVIITRSDNPLIKDITDLAGERIAIPKERHMGGYLAQAFELHRYGIFSPNGVHLIESGSHDAVVAAVLNREVNVGFIRTGVLEQLQQEQGLDLSQLQVIHSRKEDDFPFLLSTELYPEWAFVALPWVNSDLVRRVTAALLLLERDHLAARQANIGGFAPPADYIKVEQLAQKLQLPPYDTPPPITLQQFWHHYAIQLTFMLSLIIFGSLVLILLSRSHHRLQESNRALIRSEERFQLAMRGSHDGLWDWDLLTNQIYYSPRWMEMLGYEADELPQTLTTWKQLLQEQDRHHSWQQIEAYIEGHRTSLELELQMRHKQGHRIDILSRGFLVRDENLRPTRLVGTHVDISRQKQYEQELQLAASVFINAREGIVITKIDGTIIEVNSAFEEITGYRRQEVIGKSPAILKSGRQGEAFYQQMWQQLQNEGHWSGQIWNRRKDGSLYAEKLNISSVTGATEKLQNYIGFFSDITLQKQNEEQLNRLAHYDLLTNLPNRTLLIDRLEQDMRRTHRRRQLLAVIFLDLDRFKIINEQYGHPIGDEILLQLSQKMAATLREGDTLARIGGDEFVAIVTDLEHDDQGLPLFNRLLEAAAEPLSLDEITVRLSASLGISYYPQVETIDAEQLLRQADQAMYQAKQAGKNRFQIFDTEVDHHVRQIYGNLQNIHQALEQNQLLLYYQPKVNLHTGQVTGCEALLRWNHPERGILPPAAFLLGIDNYPVICDVGDWVLHQALQQLQQWNDQGLSLSVSVNIAARHLQQPGFSDSIAELLQRYPKVAPKQLILEILETSALDNIEASVDIFRRCRRLGVRFALDDFGIGYSSLAYLKQLPVNELKIDQHFVRDMLDDPDDFAILEGVLGLANAFRLDSVAEGMESVEHGVMLIQLGCEQAQGYGIARPMPAANIPDWIAQWQPEPAWAAVQPATQDNQSVLYACIEHRAWVGAVERYITVKNAPLPELQEGICRFGYWLHKQQQLRNETILDDIIRSHSAIHQFAARLIDDYHHQPQADYQMQLQQLHDLRDQLLAELRFLSGMFTQ
ncbi:EAL domain-containing protein [Ectothiorhodospiraceae bacterium BW-2]|nr:EAL domain-containing protein [Ectothiorhodospiraceae bacterium BW-2]